MVVFSAEVYVVIARSFYQFIKGRKALRADDISAQAGRLGSISLTCCMVGRFVGR
jgi:fucose permease